MRMFDVQGIEIMAPRHKVFEFLREPGNLPRWAHAFVSAGNGRARLETPAGAVDVGSRGFSGRRDGHRGLAAGVSRRRRGDRPVTRDRDDAWNLYLQLRPARATSRARTGRRRARRAAA